jgi:hypothetical protein
MATIYMVYMQARLPHIHMLIWLENALVFGVDKDEDVITCAFVVLVWRDWFFPFSTLLLPVCK